MKRLMVITLKAGGIAVLYSTIGVLLCMTVKAWFWDLFLGWYAGERLRASRLFVDYYDTFLLVVTAFVAFFAGRSYRPHFQIGGVLTGAAAALIFRLVEHTQHSAGREQSILSTFLAASLFGLIFGLIGSICGSRQKPNKALQRTAAQLCIFTA
jgi:hypothetical protein